MPRADIYVGSELAGWITQTDAESVFEYRSGLAPSKLPGGGIALGLSLEQGPFRTPGNFLHPFFANLLPEGFRLESIRNRYRVSADDAFSILLRVGSHTVGDVTVVPEGATPKPDETEIVDPTTIRFREMLERDLASESTIPGVQEKISEVTMSVPVRAKIGPSILKLSPERFPRLVENESFFMRMALACGVEVTETELVEDQTGEAGLLVRRFDRTRAYEKLHQEDGCQLLQVYPGSKYSVSWRSIVEAVIQVCDAPLLQLRALNQQIAFCYLIGNGDFHAKNVSVFLSGRGFIELTPGYDILSTLAYPGLERNMALKLDGRDDGLKRTHLQEFFGQYGLNAKIMDKSLAKILDVAPKWIDQIEEIGYDSQTTDWVKAEINRRVKSIWRE